MYENRARVVPVAGNHAGMAYPADAEPYQFHCPLCETEQQMNPRQEAMCPVCGAELHIFGDRDEANQFAEQHKARGESVRWRQVRNGPYWVVGHKETPSEMAA